VTTNEVVYWPDLEDTALTSAIKTGVLLTCDMAAYTHANFGLSVTFNY